MAPTPSTRERERWEEQECDGGISKKDLPPPPDVVGSLLVGAAVVLLSPPPPSSPPPPPEVGVMGERDGARDVALLSYVR